jgi:hypothetical protein
MLCHGAIKGPAKQDRRWRSRIENGRIRGGDTARSIFERGLALYHKCNDRWGEALSSFHLGILESNLQHNDIALGLFEQSYKQFHALGDIFFMSRLSLFLGYLHLDLDHQEQACSFFEENLRLDSELKFWAGIAEALRDLGKWHRHQGGTIKRRTSMMNKAGLCAGSMGWRRLLPDRVYALQKPNSIKKPRRFLTARLNLKSKI